MVLILFRPFDIAKWFALGFSAWLATLGQGGCGSGGGGNIPGDTGGGEMAEAAEEIGAFVRAYLPIILTVLVIVVLIGAVIGLVLLWINSRGQFMLLSNVARNRSDIKAPWRAYQREGDSLFLWRLVFSLVCLLLALLILGAGVLMALPAISSRSFGPSVVLAIVVTVLLFICYGIVVGSVTVLLQDFVVPIMYVQRLRTTAAWRVFMGLFGPNFWRFVLYLLVRLGLDLAAGVVILLVVLCTCCCAGIVLAIPYLGAVLLLPYTVFFRALGVEYLRQYGAAYDALPTPPGPATFQPGHAGPTSVAVPDRHAPGAAGESTLSS
jgi:hypothetical protein